MRTTDLAVNPCLGARSDKPPPKRARYLTDSELAAIIANSDERLAACIELAYAAALRISDMPAPRWRD